MDDDSDSDDGPQNSVLFDVRIVKIKSVAPSHDFVYGLLRQCQPGLFPKTDSKTDWTYAAAVRAFKGRPKAGNDRNGAARSGGSGNEGGSGGGSDNAQDEPVDLDGMMLMTGYGTEHSEAMYDHACENRFASLRKLVGVRAECEVTYVPTSASKRARVAPKRAIINGDWPTLSTAVRFEVSALPMSPTASLPRGQTTLDGVGAAAATPELFDATTKGCSIVPTASNRASVGDFYDLLRFHSLVPQNSVNIIVKWLFPTLYGQPIPEDGICVHRTLTDAIDGPPNVAEPMRATYDVTELVDAIDRTKRPGWHTIDHTRTFFSTATLFFHGAEVRRLFRSYARDVVFDIVTRGRKFTTHVNWLLTHAPHVLSLRKLKYDDLIHKQIALRAARRAIPNRTDDDRHRGALLDYELASMRGMLMLPDRELLQYRESLAENERLRIDNVLPPVEQAIVMTAIDFYTLMLHDQAARESMYANDAHRRRIEQSEHGVTSGHMYTVIDSTARSALVGHDSSSSLGTVSLDDWPADTEPLMPHQQPLPPPPPVQVAAAAAAMHIDAHPEFEDDDDAATLTLPIMRLPVAPLSMPIAQPPGSSAAAETARLRAVHDFSDTISRLAISCTPKQLVAAIRWLIAKNVVTRVPMIGSGPRNEGRPFDAFYLTSVYNAQAKCVAALKDIYQRGVADALRRYDIETAPAYDRAVAIARYHERVRELREKKQFFSRARDYQRALSIMHATAMSAEKRASTSAPLEADMLEADAADDPNRPPPKGSVLLGAAMALHSHVRQFVAGAPTPPEPADPYADLMPPAIDGRRTLTFGLLKHPDPPALGDDISLCREQTRGIERADVAPITIVTGGAGTGKTEVLRNLIAPYPVEQVCVCGFTGKVSAELARRLKVNARTIHSLLYSDVLHKQEMKRYEAILEALEAKVRVSGDFSSEFSTIVRLRRELYGILGVSEYRSPFEDIRVLVIDEASLLPFPMLESLLSAIHDYQKRSGSFLVRIIICGDPLQLYPIGYGSVLSDLIRAFPWCVQHMTINHRSEGTEIFNLAQLIAKQQLGRPGHPLPLFGGKENEGRLLTPTECRFTGHETDEERTRAMKRANDASVVFMPASYDSLGVMIGTVLELLGAVKEVETRESVALRESILTIASTRNVVAKLNDIVRSLFFGKTIDAIGDRGEMSRAMNGELVLPPAYRTRILPGDRIILRRNRHETFLVPPEDVTDDVAEGGGGGAEAQFPRVIELEDAAHECGLSSSQAMRRVVRSFYNGELLSVRQFYDEPLVITPSTYCRCGQCVQPQPPQQGARSHCVRTMYEVPIGRRALADMSQPQTIKFHMQAMTKNGRDNAYVVQGGRQRRIAVLRVVSEPDKYKEVDAGRYLQHGGQFAFAWAATVHVIQGSEAPIVIYVCVQDSVHIDASAVYTACTRPRRRLIVVGDPVVFRKMIERQPPLRRSDMWAQLALAASEVHRALHKSDDPGRLARALKIDDAVTMALLDPQRAASLMTRRQIWREYDPVKAAALDRGAAEAAENE